MLRTKLRELSDKNDLVSQTSNIVEYSSEILFFLVILVRGDSTVCLHNRIGIGLLSLSIIDHGDIGRLMNSFWNVSGFYLNSFEKSCLICFIFFITSTFHHKCQVVSCHSLCLIFPRVSFVAILFCDGCHDPVKRLTAWELAFLLKIICKLYFSISLKKITFFFVFCKGTKVFCVGEQKKIMAFIDFFGQCLDRFQSSC